MKQRLAFCSSAAAMMSIANIAEAQSITGQVTDSTGEAPLQGAIVSIEGLNRSVSTDRYGDYRITNVPSGTYSIIVDYVGAETVSNLITVPETGTTADFTIGADTRFLDNVLVVGSAAAQAGSINQQRAADNIRSIVDSDGLGNFPDTTVADTLARVPGLSIVTDQGEGRYVSIRGINTDLIATSINGVRTPSPEDRRGVLLDGVPSDLLDGIEVQKSLTPDLDADSLGGIINLKTISAFDRKSQFLRAKIEGQWNEITRELSPKATFTYSNIFNDNFGVAISANYQDRRIEAHNNEIGEFDFDNGIAYLNDDYEHRWYDLTRERFGLVANFDWRVNANTDLYLRTLINNYVDDEVRNKFEFRDLDDSEETEDGGIIAAGATTVPLNEVDAEVRVREETRNIQTIALGGSTSQDDWTFDYEVSYAFADEQDDNNHDVTFRFEDIQDDFPGTVTFDLSNPETPRISGTQSLLDAVYNPSNYDLDGLEREFSVNEDTEVSARFDISKESLLGNTPITWKAGVKFRDREKTRNEDFLFFEPDLNLANFARDSFIDNWRLANPQPTWPDPSLTQSLRSFNNPEDPDFDEESSFFDSNIADYVIDERILAGYAMGTFRFDKLTLVAGVRAEETDIDLEGRLVAEDDLSAIVTQFSDNYTNVLPSLNAKYAFNNKLIGRAAYYAAVVRPAFGEVAPFVEVNDDRDEAAVGNPNLDPFEADNFDLSLEYYPTELSVLSVGIFYKDIKNAIYGANFDIEDLPANIDVSNIPADLLNGDEGDTGEIEEISTFINVDDSEIFGIEFNYVQSLKDLHPALDGFLASANLTLSESESTLPDGREVPFRNQANTVWNVALGYDKGPWDLRISANFRSNNLDELIDPELDRTIDDRMLVEASAKYKVNDNLQLYLEGKNLTDEPEYYYFGSDNRMMQYDEFGTSWILGARYTF
ncbi:MAG: TonB-dependent receptor [Hyphomonas sp. TMED17]|nr:MAG: TonB-dependent receptor [Hyphomonas sp. TMED17]